MKNIQERIVKCENEISAIKTSQATQADSYMFYVYQSDNLFSRYDPSDSGITVEVVFHPAKADSSQVVCNFSYTELFRGVSEVFSVPPADPLRATLWISKRQIPGEIEEWQKHIYLTCVSNVEGFLQTIIY